VKRGFLGYINSQGMVTEYQPSNANVIIIHDILTHTASFVVRTSTNLPSKCSTMCDLVHGTIVANMDVQPVKRVSFLLNVLPA
jgi:hypothetical protein